MSNYNPYGIPQYGVPGYQSQQTNYYAIVNGFDGARNYPVAINQSILLMDSNNPIVYKKTANGLGQTTIEPYKLVAITEQEARGQAEEQPQVEYALKSDLVKLQKKIDELNKLLKKENKEE